MRGVPPLMCEGTLRILRKHAQALIKHHVQQSLFLHSAGDKRIECQELQCGYEASHYSIEVCCTDMLPAGGEGTCHFNAIRNKSYQRA